jgi:hypothetical protein
VQLTWPSKVLSGTALSSRAPRAKYSSMDAVSEAQKERGSVSGGRVYTRVVAQFVLHRRATDPSYILALHRILTGRAIIQLWCGGTCSLASPISDTS